jgi:hypothetical protein
MMTCFLGQGQALVLLTKTDFLRRSPEGGEVLYYALQRLICRCQYDSIVNVIERDKHRYV